MKPTCHLNPSEVQLFVRSAFDLHRAFAGDEAVHRDPTTSTARPSVSAHPTLVRRACQTARSSASRCHRSLVIAHPLPVSIRTSTLSVCVPVVTAFDPCTVVEISD